MAPHAHDATSTIKLAKVRVFDKAGHVCDIFTILFLFLVFVGFKLPLGYFNMA